MYPYQPATVASKKMEFDNFFENKCCRSEQGYVYLKLLSWNNTIFRNYRIRHLHALGVVSSRVEPGDWEEGRVALRLAPPGGGWLMVAALVEEEDPCRWTGGV